jgi:lipopolysaccharide biosynthesis protein
MPSPNQTDHTKVPPDPERMSRPPQLESRADSHAYRERFIFKALTIYWAVRDRMLPRGTRRRLYFDRGIAALRVLRMEGPRGLWWRIRERTQTKAPGRKQKRISKTSLRQTGVYTEWYRQMMTQARNEQPSEYVPEVDDGFPAGKAPVRLIAFYLPQYHPIPENDEWWGRGFTDWFNVSKAVPQFAGHYQPHLPGELGYYDLRVPDVQHRQVQLARKYGLHGFCFYYYWFNGRRLLERPLDRFLADPETDYPFCLCWANENWTRRWDGRDGDILIGQVHTKENDLAFIRDVEPILRHRNYIRIEGRPLLMVYRAQLMMDPAATTIRWREHCRKAGVGDPYLVAAQTFGFTDPREVGFDAAVEFPPHSCVVQEITGKVKFINPDFTGKIHAYRDVASEMVRRPAPAYPLFKTVFPGWDNEPRRPGRGLIYAFSTPDDYQQWLTEACRYAASDKALDKRIVFINAWNEWAEGAHLEPDRKYGYAYLDATSKALQALMPK